MRRFIAGVLVTALAVVAAACSGSSDSSSPSTQAASAATVTCRTVSGTDDVGQKLTFSGCTGPTGGTGTVMGPFASPTVIHWASGGTTQVVFDSNMQQTGTPTCPTQLTIMDGRVVASTEAGITGAVHGTFCIDDARSVSQAPGSTFTL